MTILAVCGEQGDFNAINSASLAVSNSGTSTHWRTSFSRAGMVIGASSANANTTFAQVKLKANYTSLWVTARIFHNATTGTVNNMVLGFGKSTTRRIGLFWASSAKLRLAKVNAAGTITELAVESGTFTNATLYKYDIQLINFGASGTINVYRANADGTGSTLILSYTGDLTTDSITNLDEVDFQGNNNPSGYIYSEIICDTSDTRSFSLETAEPTANGNTYQWSGSFADVDEATLSDADLISTTTNNHIAQFAYNSSRIGTPTTIKGVVISARAQAGGGITQLTPNMRLGGTDYYGTAITADVSLAPVQGIFETNPATGLAFTAAELTTVGVNYGFRANT